MLLQLITITTNKKIFIQNRLIQFLLKLNVSLYNWNREGGLTPLVLKNIEKVVVQCIYFLVIIFMAGRYYRIYNKKKYVRLYSKRERERGGVGENISTIEYNNFTKITIEMFYDT